VWHLPECSDHQPICNKRMAESVSTNLINQICDVFFWVDDFMGFRMLSIEKIKNFADCNPPTPQYRYICVYIYENVRIHVHVYTYICIRIYIYICVCIYICVYMDVQIQIYINIYKCTYIYTYMCVYIHKYVYVYIHIDFFNLRVFIKE